mgnify:CR=1 FL=1
MVRVGAVVVVRQCFSEAVAVDVLFQGWSKDGVLFALGDIVIIDVQLWNLHNDVFGFSFYFKELLSAEWTGGVPAGPLLDTFSAKGMTTIDSPLILDFVVTDTARHFRCL